jgi:RPA family protein
MAVGAFCVFWGIIQTEYCARTIEASYRAVDLVGKRADWRRLPEDIRKKIRGEGVERLERLRSAIEKDAGIPMPPIRVEP